MIKDLILLLPVILFIEFYSVFLVWTEERLPGKVYCLLFIQTFWNLFSEQPETKPKNGWKSSFLGGTPCIAMKTFLLLSIRT